ncbi:hypothetical protein ISS30_05070 [bacterium]|nr:hypothetical protein [bacterium]
MTEKISTENEHLSGLSIQNLITSISTKFINLAAAEIDEGIRDALCQIGEFAGVDRSYVFQFYDDGKMMNNTHEWCAQGIPPEIDNLQSTPTDSSPGGRKSSTAVRLSIFPIRFLFLHPPRIRRPLFTVHYLPSTVRGGQDYYRNLNRLNILY